MGWNKLTNVLMCIDCCSYCCLCSFWARQRRKPWKFLRPNFLIMFSALAVFGLLFGEIGDRIPFWNDYIGGGTILVFFMAAVFGTYNLVPENFMKAVNVFYGKQPVNFLEMFIPALIVGSVLTVDRKTLIKSISGYIPLIIIGVIGASIGGIVVGLIFGKILLIL